MERAVIIGTFEFLGFHFCKYLLDQGIEVTGIHITKKEDNDFLEEKRMEVGRNANFHEKVYESWISNIDITEKNVFFIDFYDFYMRKQLSFLKKNSLFEKFIGGNSQELKKTGSKIVFLLPVQQVPFINEKIRSLRTELPLLQCFYLPSIYGPWQSNSFIFQQHLLKSLENGYKIQVNERELIHDVLYIDDAVDTIIKLAKQTDNSFILRSDFYKYWRECAQFLSIPLESLQRSTPAGSIDEEIHQQAVESSVDFSEGIRRQKRHFELLKNLGYR